MGKRKVGFFEAIGNMLGALTSTSDPKPEILKTTATPRPEPPPNALIEKGCQFYANMSFRTPLSVLERHGEIFPGPIKNAPVIADYSEGFWVPLAPTWKDLGIDLPEFPDMEVSSEFGPVPEDGGHCLPFLKEFRKVVESDIPTKNKVKLLKEIPKNNSKYRRYAKPYFAEKWFGLHVSCIPGIGEKISKLLIESGIKTVVSINRKNDKELLAIKGIGPSTVQILRDYYESKKGEL